MDLKISLDVLNAMADFLLPLCTLLRVDQIFRAQTSISKVFITNILTRFAFLAEELRLLNFRLFCIRSFIAWIALVSLAII